MMAPRDDAGYSSTPWTVSQDAGSVTWSTETFAQNPNANAIRFGTIYNFRFEASNVSATAAMPQIGFFKTGAPMSVELQAPQWSPRSRGRQLPHRRRRSAPTPSASYANANYATATAYAHAATESTTRSPNAASAPVNCQLRDITPTPRPNVLSTTREDRPSRRIRARDRTSVRAGLHFGNRSIWHCRLMDGTNSASLCAHSCRLGVTELRPRLCEVTAISSPRYRNCLDSFSLSVRKEQFPPGLCSPDHP